MKWGLDNEAERCRTDRKTNSAIPASGESGVPLNEQRLLDAWPQVLGPAASYTSNLYIRNQTLYVHLTSAALRQELMMGRELLVRTLNQRVGATVITNIIFR